MEKEPSEERTLLVVKPDGVARGLVGRILQQFEDAMLKAVGVKLVQVDDELARRHYFDLEERHGSETYNATASFIR